MAEEDSSPLQNLHELFHEGLNLYNQINSSNEPMNSLDVQLDVKKAIEIFENCTKLVSLADIFSKNEEIEELETNNIQYLMLPALLGMLTSKITNRERKEIIEVSEIYFKDFLLRTNNYNLSNYNFGAKTSQETEKTELEQLTVAVNTRATKIQKFREHQELKAHLTSLKKNTENPHCDEDIKRQYFLTMIKIFIYDVISELDSIEQEKPILEHMAKVKQDGAPKLKKQPPKPLRPIIITKDEVQKAVYGAGYPSLPIMTVQEFYDKRVADGVFPDPTKQKPPNAPLSLQEASLAGVSNNDSDKEDEDEENKVERDDDEYIEKMRTRDEWRDDHRRGWGNRMNRS